MKEQIEKLTAQLEWLRQLQDYRPPSAMTIGEALARIGMLLPESENIDLELNINVWPQRGRDKALPTASWRLGYYIGNIESDKLKIVKSPTLAGLVEALRQAESPQTVSVQAVDVALGSVSENHHSGSADCCCESCERSAVTATANIV